VQYLRWLTTPPNGDQISDSAPHHAFSVLRRELGWTATGRTRAPRIQDLRHRMVVRRIQAWHAEDAKVDAMIAVLATYLGHVEVRDLYCYLSAVPELMGIVADRFEAFAGHPPEGVSWEPRRSGSHSWCRTSSCGA